MEGFKVRTYMLPSLALMGPHPGARPGGQVSDPNPAQPEEAMWVCRPEVQHQQDGQEGAGAV